MKRHFFIPVLVSLAFCFSAEADGPIRGFTSTQTMATGNSSGSFDAYLRGLSGTANSKKAVKDATRKDIVFIAPVRPQKVKTAHDDRQVIVTRDAIVADSLVIKTKTVDQRTAPSLTAGGLASSLQLSKVIVAQTGFSPLLRSE